jgi:hypothetical protein
MGRFAKALSAGVGALALMVCAFSLWLHHEIASIVPGYIEVTPNKPRLIAVSLLTFATAFIWQYRASGQRSFAPHSVSNRRTLVFPAINLLGSVS